MVPRRRRAVSLAGGIPQQPHRRRGRRGAGHHPGHARRLRPRDGELPGQVPRLRSGDFAARRAARRHRARLLLLLRQDRPDRNLRRPNPRPCDARGSVRGGYGFRRAVRPRPQLLAHGRQSGRASDRRLPDHHAPSHRAGRRHRRGFRLHHVLGRSHRGTVRLGSATVHPAAPTVPRRPRPSRSIGGRGGGDPDPGVDPAPDRRRSAALAWRTAAPAGVAAPARSPGRDAVGAGQRPINPSMRARSSAASSASSAPRTMSIRHDPPPATAA